MALSIAWGHAQTLSNNKLRRGLDDFRKQTRSEFEDFRKQAMNEFISFVRNPWKDFEHTRRCRYRKKSPSPRWLCPKKTNRNLWRKSQL
mgnify:CR=1 FL=1